MKTNRHLTVLLATFWCLASSRTIKSAEGCPDLDGKDAAAHVQYLSGDRPKLVAACVISSVKYLGIKPHAAQASAVLIKYLDYPDQRSEQVGGKAWTTLYRYPAVDVLSSFGKPVVPELIAAIVDADSPDLVRRNAAFTIGLIYGLTRPEPISVLVTAAHAQADPLAENRLMDEARWLAARCIPQYRNDCENAVLK